MRLQRGAFGGGLSYREELQLKAFQRLDGKLADKHHTIVLPCCKTMIEVADLTRDTYGTCPNRKCGKPYAVLGNNNKPQVQTELSDAEPHRHIIW